MDRETMVKLFNEKKASHSMNFTLKDEQVSVALAILQGRNCVTFLPTGYGKTLCFVIPAVVQDHKPNITLIISPLLSLMDDQIRTITAWNFTCIRIGPDTSHEESAGVADGKYEFVFGSPESLLKPKWRQVFLSNLWQERLSCIVLDEAHCISEWGESFRPDYKNVGELRSFFKAPVLAMTATCTDAVKCDIMSSLQLNESDSDIVSISPDRENIFISCLKKRSSDYETELSWLVDYLKINGKNAKKIIIYCRSIDTVSEIFITLKECLGKYAYVDYEECAKNLIVEMFHKCTDDHSKTRILSEFTKINSTIRCIVATVALGMGIDIPDVELVLHIGCPSSVVSYWQEAGRCARDGRQGFSAILYDNFTASLKTTDKRMADIVRTTDDSCLRKKIMETFASCHSQPSVTETCKGCDNTICTCKLCKCCSVCCKKCPCAERGTMTLSYFLGSV